MIYFSEPGPTDIVGQLTGPVVAEALPCVPCCKVFCRGDNVGMNGLFLLAPPQIFDMYTSPVPTVGVQRLF